MEEQKLSTDELIAQGPIVKGFFEIGAGKILSKLLIIEIILVLISWLGASSFKNYALWLGLATFLFFIYTIIEYFSACKGATLDYFNANNDGIYYHYCNNTSMLLNINTRTLTLTDHQFEQTYDFDDIEGLRCEVYRFDSVLKSEQRDREVRKYLSGDRKSDVGTAIGENIFDFIYSAKKALENSGLFIKVRDIEDPVWQIYFYPKDSSPINRTKGKGMDDVKKQIQTWREVFKQALSKR